MDFDKVVEKRKSVRSFKNKRPNWKEALLAIDSAVQSPYTGNLNNMKFVIVEDPATISKLADFAQQTWINEAPLVIVACADDSLLENQYGERGRIYSRQQAGASIQTLLLKLTDLGLSSCWVGSYTDELIKNHLRIPAHWQIEALIPVGYENKKPGTVNKPRKRELAKSIYWGGWETSRRSTVVKEGPMYKEPYK